MADNIEILILEHLQALRSGMERLEFDQKEIKARVASLESGQATIIQHLGAFDRDFHRSARPL